ncbi:MAG: ABC transporter permease [Hyphomonadaceae bacterium]|nr:ABC transporter permease [Hyphomonadaceae bacterium]
MRRPPFVLYAGAAIVAALGACALLAPWIAPYPPNAVDSGMAFAPPSATHWAGADGLGRDVFSRIVHGARPSLLSAVGIVAIGLGGGALIGALAALIGGATEQIVMRVTEIVMALPGLVIALALTAALGPSLVNLTLALGVLSIPFYVRLVRGETLTLRERGFVKAARAMGAGPLWLAVRHIAPNLAPVLAVYGTMGLSGAVLAASALSFVGLGAQPPMAEWGALIFDGSQTLLTEWWVAVFPGIAVALSALGFNLLGDGLRDWLDPRGDA